MSAKGNGTYTQQANTTSGFDSASDGPGPIIGVSEQFRAGDHEQVERVLKAVQTLGVDRMCVELEVQDLLRPEGRAWYDWLIPRLSEAVELLPRLPVALPLAETDVRPSQPRGGADEFEYLLAEVLSRYGGYFSWLELDAGRHRRRMRNGRTDLDWSHAVGPVRRASERVHNGGKQVVLGGLSHVGESDIALMHRTGLLEAVDAIGLRTREPGSKGERPSWCDVVSVLGRELERRNAEVGLWITDSGRSTGYHQEFGQLQEFVSLVSAPVDRVYWYRVQDVHQGNAGEPGDNGAEGRTGYGLLRADGTPGLLYRILAEHGIEGARELVRVGNGSMPALPENGQGKPNRRSEENLLSPAPGVRTGSTEDYVLVTGGAGFIGSNLAHRLLASGRSVCVLDNLSRPGVEENLRWLVDTHGDRVQVAVEDIRNSEAVRRALRGAEKVFHLAAQVAVTTSVADPVEDFEINLRGTLNLLEAARSMSTPPPCSSRRRTKCTGICTTYRSCVATVATSPAIPRSRNVVSARITH